LNDGHRIHFVSLIERFCKLGRRLPPMEDIDTDDDARLAEIKTVLAEMEKQKPKWMSC
jgi:hypothetical protein